MNQEDKKFEELLSDPQMKQIWDMSANYSYEEANNNDQAWNNFQHKIQANQKQVDAKPTLKVSYSRLLAYAAALGLVILSVGVYFSIDKYNAAHPLTAKVENSSNEVKELSLPDGSKISLNAHSTVEYNLTADARNITLSGQAHFEVAPNKEAPFKVETVKGAVTVLGTGFDVTAYPAQELSVSVSHGKVKVEVQKQSVILTKGMSAATLNNQLSLVQVDSNCVVWRGKNLEFNNSPIQTVLTTLENTYGVKFNIVGNSPKPLRENAHFTGKFKRNQSINDIEVTLETAFNCIVEVQKK